MAIKDNQIVSMRYELSINDEIIESNLHADPIKFTVGKGEVVPGLEKAIKESKEGDYLEIEVSPTDAYGVYDEKLTETLPLSDFEGIDLEIGLVLEGEGENGELFKATVSEVTKDTVTMDYNHPLAGKVLNFKVYVDKIA